MSVAPNSRGSDYERVRGLRCRGAPERECERATEYAALRAFQGGPEIDDYLVRSQRILRALANLLARQLRAVGAEVRSPEGGFYLFPDFSPRRERLAARGMHTSSELCQRLLEDTGVAILPGSDFGQPAEQLSARIAYVDFDGRTALMGASEVSSDWPLDEVFCRTHCARVVEAVGRICTWLQQE